MIPAEKPGIWEQSAQLSFRFIIASVVVLTFVWLFSNVRQVDADSQAVVFRFGEISREKGPGLLLAWPRPLEEVVIVPSRETQLNLQIQQYEQEAILSTGYTRPEMGGSLVSNSLMFGGYVINREPRANASFLMTGDFSVIHLESVLIYQVTSPSRYVLSKDLLQPALTRLYNASAVAVAASRELDTILVARPELAAQELAVSGRERLRSDLASNINRRLDEVAARGADLGIRITRIDLNPSIPYGAKSAFDYVLVAAQQAEAAVARARTEAELTAQRASQEIDRIRTQAEAGGQESINDATRRTAAISSLSESGSETPLTVLRKLYAERVKSVLNRAGHIDAVDRGNGVRVILPGKADQ